MGYAVILGLDLGKFKSVCCAMDADTGRHAIETLATTPAAITELLVEGHRQHRVRAGPPTPTNQLRTSGSDPRCSE